MKKRIWLILLCLFMAAAFLPTAAFAAQTGAMQLGAGGIAKDNKVYFGQKGTTVVPWIALDDSGFLLSEYTLGTSKFRDLWDWGYYNYSTERDEESAGVLKTTMDGLYNGAGTTLFTDLERGAIEETRLAGNSMYDDSTPAVDAHLFPLSFAEAESIGWNNPLLIPKKIEAPEELAGWWWLRSSAWVQSEPDTYCVWEAGLAGLCSGEALYGVRPAFHLNLSSVLFTSAAVGGKIPAAAGGGALFEIPSATPSEWKLTLLDNDRDFTAATAALNGNTLTLAYSGAATGADEYVSAIVKDASGNVTHYGRLKNTAAAADASGTVDIDLSAVDMTDKTLYLFSEQYNGGANDDTLLPDYASELAAVSLPQRTYAITNTLTNITSDNTATCRPVSDAADYTATLTADPNYALPATITVKVGGDTLAAGATTYEYNHASGALRIYAGSITGDLEITAAGVASAPGVDSPKTGDNSTPAAVAGVMLAACAGLAGSLVIRRRRQNGSTERNA